MVTNKRRLNIKELKGEGGGGGHLALFILMSFQWSQSKRSERGGGESDKQLQTQTKGLNIPDSTLVSCLILCNLHFTSHDSAKYNNKYISDQHFIFTICNTEKSSWKGARTKTNEDCAKMISAFNYSSQASRNYFFDLMCQCFRWVTIIFIQIFVQNQSIFQTFI